MVMLSAADPMRVLLRTRERLFTDDAVAQAGGAKVIVNGNMYDVTRAGIADALIGSDPVAASETTPLGQVVHHGTVLGGTAQANLFHFAQNSVALVGPPAPGEARYTALMYQAGFGPAPSHANVKSAIGGAGPLIVDGLKFGDGNRYRAGATGSRPATGRPPVAARPFLTQRNNNTYIAFANRGAPVGKTIVASSYNRGRLLVLVQEDGTSGHLLDHIRDRLFDLEFDNAVFLDGSDSSCLWHGGSWQVAPGSNKNETNTVGIAFG